MRLPSVFLGFLLFAVPAHAQPVDTVQLANGGFMRGTITESVPNDHVTIVLFTGEVRRIPWSDVAKVEAAAAPAQAPAQAPAPPIQGPTATVHVTSPVPVVLDRRPAGADASVPACDSPCDTALPIHDTYRVQGADLRSSGDIRLTAPPGSRTEIVVTPARKTTRAIGMSITTFGAGFALIGLPMLIAGIVGAAESCGPNSPNSVYVTPDGSYTQCRQEVANERDIRTAGIALTAIGVTASVIGLWLWLKNETTRVEERPLAPAVAERIAAPRLVRMERRPDEAVLPLVDLAF